MAFVRGDQPLNPILEALSASQIRVNAIRAKYADTNQFSGINIV